MSINGISSGISFWHIFWHSIWHIFWAIYSDISLLAYLLAYLGCWHICLDIDQNLAYLLASFSGIATLGHGNLLKATPSIWFISWVGSILSLAVLLWHIFWHIFWHSLPTNLVATQTWKQILYALLDIPWSCPEDWDKCISTAHRICSLKGHWPRKV